MRTIIAPYSMGSASARLLAEALDATRIRNEGSRFRPRYDDLIVNWGRSDLPRFPIGRVMNHPDAVGVCSNKLSTFRAFAEHLVPTVDWTTEQAVADGWVREGYTIMARRTLNGRGGAGIEVINGASHPEGFRPAPLYTKYHKRKHEFRVHVFDGKVISLQQKKLRNGTEKTDRTFLIRNADNGWVFARNDIEVPEAVQNAALLAVRSLGLDFGGVDIGWNETEKRAYVYEVNSAPGIEGTTVEDYRNAIAAI